MALLRGDKVSLSYGTHHLLREVDFAIEPGEKVALVGRNGAGKSSLMKLIVGHGLPDSGAIQQQKHLRVRYLDQQLPAASDQSVFDFVAGGVADIKDALERYQAISESGEQAAELSRLHDLLDQTDGWHWQNKVERTLTSPDHSVRTTWM